MSDTENYNKLFVGGDLSGIQKYLYNVTSKKAAVSLKGRSFYLRQYMENVCSELMNLQEAKDAQARTIYCSGGKFYIVMDNTDVARETLAQKFGAIKTDMWIKHQGQLAINLSMIPFTENPDGSVNVHGEKGRKLGFLWQCVTEDFARQKSQKFLKEMQNDYDSFFEVIPVGGKTKVCAVTGIESDKCKAFITKFQDYDDDSKPILVLPSVKEQIQLGEALRDKERTHTFEEYAENTYLGVLRMDVDGLGKAFADAKDLQTFDKYTAFSTQLDRYFTTRPEEDYISNLEALHQTPEYRDYMNILYAGGDDIFVVGRWDKVIEFAEEVRNDFVKYIKKDGISISGGIAIVHPKFPIAKAAELAGEAEDKAKAYEKEGKPKKNAFCLFGQAVSWDGEFEYVKQYKDEFIEKIEDFGMPRGILHKIISYASTAEKNKALKAKGKMENYSYIWHSAYYLTRMIERQKNNRPVVEFCRMLRDKELNRGTDNFRLMALAARWAELKIRMNQNK